MSPEKRVSVNVAGVERDSALQLDDSFIVASLYEGE